jgi:hypothetical protein
MTLPESCSLSDIFDTTSLDWGRFGVGFISNLYNSVIESIVRGLQNLHPQFKSGCRLLKNPIPSRFGFFCILGVLPVADGKETKDSIVNMSLDSLATLLKLVKEINCT